MNNSLAVFLDLDYTIWGHAPFEVRSQKIAEYLKIPFSQEFTNQALDFWEHDGYLRGCIVTREGTAQKLDQHLSYLTKYGQTGEKYLKAMFDTDDPFLLPGALDMLQFLKNEETKIIAYTDWFSDDQEMTMKNLNIHSFFDEVQGWDGTYMKPDAMRIIEIAKRYKDRKLVYIGDSLSDMQSARSIKNCTSIWYNPNRKHFDEKVSFDYEIENLLEVRTIIGSELL